MTNAREPAPPVGAGPAGREASGLTIDSRLCNLALTAVTPARAVVHGTPGPMR
jgi:hypothetical protein